MAQKPTLIVKDKLYIPKKNVDISLVKAGFERHVFKETGCARCPIFKEGDRFSDTCATCENYLGFYKTWKLNDINGKKYVSVPLGDRKRISKVLNINFKEFTILDQRANVPMKHKIKFTGKLYTGKEVINGVTMANQVKMVDDYAKHYYGILKSAPRTGKTVCMVKIACNLNQRTLFLADEIELLKQALRTLYSTTNIRDLEEKYGRKIAGIIRKPKDWGENWDIVLVPYQMFIREGTGHARFQKYVLGKFGLVLVDELHKAGAACFAKVVNSCDSKYRGGVTATTERKDGLDFLYKQIVGPITSVGTSVSLIPKLDIIETKCKPKYEWKGRSAFTYASTWQAKNKARNILLVKQVFKDLREDKRNCIVIPVMRINHAKTLVKMINKQAAVNNDKRNETWDENLAIEYHGKTNRDSVLQAARSGKKTRVVVAYHSMVQKGVDVKVWNIMYLQLLMANDTNFYQMTQRICTPLENKPQPVLRYFVDDFSLSKGCFSSTFRNSILKYKYMMTNDVREIAYSIIDKKKQGIQSADKMISDW